MISQLLDSPTAIPLPDAPAAPPSRRSKPRRPAAGPEVGIPTEPPEKGRGEVEGEGSPEARPLRFADADLIGAAQQIAKELHGCSELAERIAVYKETGERFKSDYRRVLNFAAARWPELVPMVNDLPEWKALLSADLS